MQATIERESSFAMARRRVVVDVITQEASRPYRAPLATFLALAASARATAERANAGSMLDAEAGVVAFSRN